MAAHEFSRVVVRVPNPLGDAVLAIPAMAALRHAFQRSTLLLAAAPSVAPLFHETTPVAPDVLLTVEKDSEVPALREADADLAILLTNSFRTAWAARRAGIRERWGYRAHGRSLLLTRAVKRPGGRTHQSEYYLNLVRTVAEMGTEKGTVPFSGVEASAVLPRVEITAETRRRAREALERHDIAPTTPLVGIAPGAAYGHAKRWPADRVAALASRLVGRGAAIVLVGAATDRDAGREIESSLPGGVRVTNLIGRTDLRLFAGVLAACHAFVSNDSGAMHLAAATGVPVTAIFGPTDERVTAPLGDHDVIIHQVFCRPCLLRDCPIDHRCMRRISVDRVFGAVAARLDARSSGGATET